MCRRRLHNAGIRCPKPILLRQHVLVMEFIGKKGLAAPRLKDAQLSEEKYRTCYREAVVNMRIIFHRCKLVHGDLSEYNLLYVPRPRCLDAVALLRCVLCFCCSPCVW